MAEPTMALTYEDLILTVAEQLGVAYYGDNGDEAAQVPTDDFLLDKCKRYVQDGIRMFVADSPPAGWRWQRPIAEVNIWQDLGISMPTDSGGSNNLATSAHVAGTTHVYVTAGPFSASHVDQVLAVKGQGVFTITTVVSATEITLAPATDFSWVGSKAFTIQDPTDAATMTGTESGGTTTITATVGSFYASTVGAVLYVTDEAEGITLETFVSDTVMTVSGDSSWVGSKTFSLPSNGIYILPQDFSGEYIGEITYAAGSNLGTAITWTSEFEIRRLRENWNGTSGNPYLAAIRVNQNNSRRWDLLIYPLSGGSYVINFPYLSYFDSITQLTDMHQAGVAHDETVKAAALAQAEFQGEDTLAGKMQYYREIALPNSLKIDGRNAPRRLGYNSNTRDERVSRRDFRHFQRRPTVSYRS